MRGVYTALAEKTITNAGNLIELECGAKSIEILRAWVTAQSPDTAEQMTIEINRITAAGAGTGAITEQSTSKDGTSATANPYNGSRAPTAANAIVRESVPNVGGFFYVPTPEERIECNGTSDGVVLRLDENLSAEHVLDCGIVWREIG
jgi:hypothetical protein